LGLAAAFGLEAALGFAAAFGLEAALGFAAAFGFAGAFAFDAFFAMTHLPASTVQTALVGERLALIRRLRLARRLGYVLHGMRAK
jgi:hypothetical protein